MGERGWPLHVIFCCILGSLVWPVGHGFYHQMTFLEPVYDWHGHEISTDRVLEMTDMKSTLLGYGYGFNYSSFSTDPFYGPFLPPFVRHGGFPETSFGRHRLAPQMRSQPRVSRRSSFFNAQDLFPHLSGGYDNSGGVSSRHQSPHHRRFKRQAVGDDLEKQILDHLSKSPREILNEPFHPRIPGEFQTGQRRRPCPTVQPIRCNTNTPYRTVDGLCNNLAHPTWGAAMQPLRRLHGFNYYHDGYDIPKLTSSVDRRRLLPSARLVSRLIHEPDRPGHVIPELTNLLQQWGQFTDHDITGTPAHKDARGEDLKCCRYTHLAEDSQLHQDIYNGGPCHPIYIPPLDRHFRYSCMNFARSEAAPRPRDCDPNAPRQPREQMNMLTAYMDGSQIYGSSLKENRKIRLYRHGMLRVTPLDLLPEDVNSTCVRDNPADYCFQAGEMRVNEHPALTTIHTVFHRLHNQMALSLYEINPGWGDEKIFQEAKKIMGAILQHVTYHDWLPIILGPKFMKDYSLYVSGPFDSPSTDSRFWYYDETANPTILNSFATAAFRFGHTLIPSTFTVGREKIRLHRMFNRPKFILRDGGESIRKFCYGLQTDSVQHMDRFISTDLSDHLFEDRNNISLDLPALNIQRARDHGLPGYNDYREVCGLPRIKNFEDFYSEEPDRAEVFRRAYDHVNDVDLFSGGISEKPMAGGIVGHTFGCIIAQQFKNIKFGDRYWYENTARSLAFTPDQVREIRSFSIAKIMCTMAPLDRVLANVFFKDGAFLPKPIVLITGEAITQNRYIPCELIKSIDMNAWRDPRAQRPQ